MKKTPLTLGVALAIGTVLSSAVLASMASANYHQAEPTPQQDPVYEAMVQGNYELFNQELTKEGATQDELFTKEEFALLIELDGLYVSENPDTKRIEEIENKLFGAMDLDDADLEVFDENDFEDVTFEDGNINNDVFVTYDVELSDEDLALLDEDFVLSDEDIAFLDKMDAVISEQERETLSMQQIDEKLTQAGLETIGDPEDPLYSKTVAEIDAMSDNEWEQVESYYYNEMFS